MKAAIASSGEKIDSGVSPHFGRCPFFFVVEDGDVDVVRNPYFQQHVPHAVPDFVAELEIDAIVAGGMGPRAKMDFDKKGIKVITVGKMTVKKVVEKLKNGELKGGEDLCEH